MKQILLALFLVGSTALSFGQTLDTLNYSIDGKPFRGFVANPAKINKKTKTILIVHEWWSLNRYPKTRALQLAKEGFIALCVDMYGAGIVVDNPTEASSLAGPFYADANLL